MRFGKTQDDRCPGIFGSLQNALEEIQTDQVKSANCITLLVGMCQHVVHVYEGHI